MSIPDIKIRNGVKLIENSLASEKIVAAQSELQPPRVLTKPGPSEVAQLVKLYQFDLLEKHLKSAREGSLKLVKRLSGTASEIAF